MTMQAHSTITMQDVLLRLQSFWAGKGCVVLPPYDLEMGAGTFHPATVLHSLGNHPHRVAYVQPSRRPADGRYGKNPNRFSKYYQFQVLLKPAPENVQQLYLESLAAIGIEEAKHDIRFVEDDWESPTLGAAGLGWEVWCDGMEVSQFTYFQQMCGIDCTLVPAELTYGVERLCMYIQGQENGFAMAFSSDTTYGELYRAQEEQFSVYCFEKANVSMLTRHFEDYMQEGFACTADDLPLPAYECCIKASHVFNILDARGVISVLQRAEYIKRIRELANAVGKCQLARLEEAAI